ncbi:hypothetical protein EVG20_g1055 [Dentipellis fragilis]|uniref:Ribosomal protein S5 domain 2-like protein n=1 Tax=Dentipellis fragilis TaxID=205917 RepID=A0A4Y9ZBU3_9AGAM|nr:hypothetical protein EVG20_g1055 [Dentipellis fragilis]
MLGVFRQPVRAALKRTRTYATASTPFVPPSSLQNVREFRRVQKVKPESPTFYTGRADYYDHVMDLETAVRSSHRALRTLQLIPLPAHALASLPHTIPVWRTREDMSGLFARKLSTSRYRRLLTLLAELESYHRIADTAGHVELAQTMSAVMQLFERADKDAVLARGRRKPVKFDRYGRSYTVGRRKESSARVWMIPVQQPEAAAEPAPAAAPVEDYSLESKIEDPLKHTESTRKSINIPTTTILVNNRPLNEIFPAPSDRERILRPFKLAGVVGAYNVFALVRGGGTTGQSGAVALGIAKGIAAHVPEVETVLRRSKVLRRDPRMVERKKTGRAKARKGYTWVKR